MRKQYHFMPSARGLLAWDVDRLIERSQSLPVVRIRPDAVRELDEVYWFDGEHERPTCRKVLDHMALIEAADLRYPVILGADGRVMDGMHRIAKAVVRGVDVIDARRFLRDPEPDYVGIPASELPY